MRTIRLTSCMCESCRSSCSWVGCDADDFIRARRELLAHRLARAAKQHGLKVFAQLGQVLVAEHLALFVDDAVPVVEAKCRAQPPVVDELHDRIEIVEPVFQRRARQHERESRAKAFDHAAGLRFPVLDALAFVQNDQVPIHAFDRQDVAQHLLVVADGEEAIVGVLTASRRDGARDELTVAVGEAMDFVPPLRFHRRGADDQHFGNAGFAREQLRHADGLDGFAQSHVVGQNGAAGSGGEGDAVELIGQQFDFEKFAAQGVRIRLAADLGDAACEPVQQQPPLDEFFRIGVDMDRVSLPL